MPDTTVGLCGRFLQTQGAACQKDAEQEAASKLLRKMSKWRRVKKLALMILPQKSGIFRQTTNKHPSPMSE